MPNDRMLRRERAKCVTRIVGLCAAHAIYNVRNGQSRIEKETTADKLWQLSFYLSGDMCMSCKAQR